VSEHRILVVDDEPSIVDAVATALRYEGYEVEEATTGREAVAAVARVEPDLVVLDWMLPDVEGIEVGCRLRERGFPAGGSPRRRLTSPACASQPGCGRWPRSP
jgi:DNA-binding response OmpR family regulator